MARFSERYGYVLDVIRKIMPILVGVILCLVNLIWFYLFAERWYEQEYLGLLVFFSFPKWFLLANMGIGLTGFVLGLGVCFRKIGMGKGFLINLILLVIGLTFVPLCNYIA